MIKGILMIIAGYLLGSIPSALIVGKLWKNIDIRNYGSGNLGATNVLRVLGPIPALITAIMDVGKGILTVSLAQYFLQNNNVFIILACISAIVGHSYPIFANFRGGRSVGVSGGILFWLFPKTTLLCLVIAFTIVYLTKYKSVGSIISAIIYPFLLSIFEKPSIEYFIVVLFASIFVIFRHIPNIKRLIQGKEHKVEWFKNKN